MKGGTVIYLEKIKYIRVHKLEFEGNLAFLQGTNQKRNHEVAIQVKLNLFRRIVFKVELSSINYNDTQHNKFLWHNL